MLIGFRFDFVNAEPMWQLGLESYPERPDEPDCLYYLRTGFCGYGNRCRFNHPRERGAVRIPTSVALEFNFDLFGHDCCDHRPKSGILVGFHVDLMPVWAMGALRASGGGYPERISQPVCQGEKECSYYVKTGQCKFGITCKFHHPQPTGVQVPAPGPAVAPGPTLAPLPVPGPLAAPAVAAAVYPTVQSPSVQSSQQYGVIPGNWPVARPAMLPGSYFPGSYGPMLLPPGVVPVPGWTPYPAPVSPVASATTQTSGGPNYGITQLSPSAAAYTGPYISITSSAGPSSSSQKESPFPERPGQPECQYYLKTGDCKFGSTCKYHHPPEWSAPKSNFLLSPMGLPLRPGAPLCSHYAQNGVCKFGPSCKFDHPMRTLSYSPSASSLTDMPVAPYPVGSTNATLAPSSSSSDLRPELLSGLSKDAFSPQMSSMNSSSASVGSIFSKSGSAPQSGVQHSGQGSGGVSSTSHGGDVHTSS
ncbi:UNVERIFIED_CONTAM: Zinc finger CCCH domain-containing protein 34 [Sesamum radiatum]|uniref:Zinc finger CCCH domain-containing protein 34 n=1 Tax=Sesamum radiatum TaxID=300843 RepID=A0AAW2QIF3_SESRA